MNAMNGSKASILSSLTTPPIIARIIHSTMFPKTSMKQIYYTTKAIQHKYKAEIYGKR